MSVLRQHSEDYLAMRRALGFRLDYPSRLLPDFISFMEPTFRTLGGATPMVFGTE